MAKSDKSKATVESTTDEAISAEQTQESSGTGEISKAAASRSPNVTREKETGKVLNPDQYGQVTAPVPEKAGKSAKTQDGQVDTRRIGATAGANRIDPKTMDLVPVKIKVYQRCKIGPTWYEFHVGQSYDVRPNVKEILKRRGALEVV